MTGNVELLVLPFVAVGVENYQLSVVPTAAARGGFVYFGPDGDQVESLTASLRRGVDQYNLSFGSEKNEPFPKLGADPPFAPATPPVGPGPAGEFLAQVLAEFRGGRLDNLSVKAPCRWRC